MGIRQNDLLGRKTCGRKGNIPSHYGLYGYLLVPIIKKKKTKKKSLNKPIPFRETAAGINHCSITRNGIRKFCRISCTVIYDVLATVLGWFLFPADKYEYTILYYAYVNFLAVRRISFTAL